MKKRVIVLAILVMAGITNVQAQTWNLPANRENTRFTLVPKVSLGMPIRKLCFLNKFKA